MSSKTRSHYMMTACGRENKKRTIAFIIVLYWTWTRNGRVCRWSSPPLSGVFGWKKLGDDAAEFRVYWYFFLPAYFLCLPVQLEVVEPLGGICVVPLAFRTRDASLLSEKKNVCVPTTRPTAAVIAWRARHRERSLGHRRLLASTTPSVYNIPECVYTGVNRCSITYRRTLCYVPATILLTPFPNYHLCLYGAPHQDGGDRLPTTINGGPIQRW